RGPQFAKEHPANILAVALVGAATAGATGDEGAAEVRICDAAVAGVVRPDNEVLEILQDVDIERRRPTADRIVEKALTARYVFLAVVGQLDAHAVIPKRLGDVDVVGGPLLELRCGRTVDQIVVEIEDRR